MADTDGVFIKRCLEAGVVPALNELQVGELALNVPDSKLYTRRSTGNPLQDTIVLLNPTQVVADPDLTEILEFSHTTPLLTPGQLHNFQLSAANLLFFQILELQVSSPAWVRVYGTPAARAADTRTSPGGVLPGAGTEFYAEVNTTGTLRFSPVPLVQTTAGIAYLSVVNQGAQPAVINLLFKTVASVVAS